jgi:VanZ family protein
MLRINPTIVPGILWLLISGILLTIPGSAFPKENWFDRLWIDKWVHLGMFFLLTVLWCWGIRYNRAATRRLFIFIALLSLVFGTSMEFVQHYVVPNRSFDPGDMIADGVGSLAGYFWSVGRYIKK